MSRGDNIPVSAKIIAIADVFDALTTSRSYRDKMDVSKAIETMNSMKGSHLEGYILEAFEKMAFELYENATKTAEHTSYLGLLKSEYFEDGLS